MNKTIYELQILRFIASMMVLISHVQHEAGEQRFLNLASYTPINPVYWGAGVDVFFVISGFIMYHLCRDQFGLVGAPANFLVRRLVRIVPPYWGATVCMLLAIWLFAGHISHAEIDPWHVLGSFLFFPVENPYGQFYPIMILGWTLQFEFLFYVVFCVGLFFSRKVGLSIIVGVVTLLGLSPLVIHFQSGPMAFWSNSIVLEFVYGIALAEIRARGFRFSAAKGWLVFAAGCGLLSLMHVVGMHFEYGLRAVWVGIPALVMCAGPALIAQRDHATNGLFKRALVFGGDASFALYLSHPFSINLVAIAASRLGVNNPWTYVALATAIALFGAALVYELIERPLTTRLSRALHMRRPRVLEAVPERT
ncbi:acyltransferase family protein [Aureimonas sp. D3]|uniref:acyltransferase family protein n=1 Tax=Aureimonas sp. D3 TaxID=1638164 RepID=UPI000783FF37|nr:acyltransferase [Aureimonas sp. D3]